MSPLESAARRRSKNAAAERRKARRRAYPTGHLRRSGDGLDREAGHRVRRSAPAPVGALLPLFFSGAENGQRAPGALRQTGGAALAKAGAKGVSSGNGRFASDQGEQQWPS